MLNMNFLGVNHAMDEREKRLRKLKRRRRRKIKRLIRRIIRFGILLLLFILLITGIVWVTKLLDKNEKESKKVDMELPQIEIEKKELQTASILSAGDVIMHAPFITSSLYKQADGSYQYDSIFKFVKDDYLDADYTIVNLESTITDDNYSGFPLLHAPEGIAASLKSQGVDMCLLANNHIYDDKDDGLFSTMEYMEKYYLSYTGTRKAEEENTYIIQDINGIKVGIFNYTFESSRSNGQIYLNSLCVSDSSTNLINTFNYDYLDEFYQKIEKGLSEMEQEGVEYTIAYIHWGTEYELTENNWQHQIATKLCELGINALIGGHPHVVQPIDVLVNEEKNQKMLCLYSIGNHLSNQRRERISSLPTGHTEDGLMVKLFLEKDSAGNVLLTDVEFIPTFVHHTQENGDDEYYILPSNDIDHLLENAGELDIESEIMDSLERTTEIIEDGVKTVQSYLPLS